MARWAEFLALIKRAELTAAFPQSQRKKIKLPSQRLARKLNNRTCRFHGSPVDSSAHLMSTPISRQGHDPRAPSTVPRAAGTRKLFSKLANIGDICPRGFVSAAGAIPADHNRATPNRRNQQNCRSSSGRSGLLSTWTKLTPPASHPTLAHLARHDWSAGYQAGGRPPV